MRILPVFFLLVTSLISCYSSASNEATEDLNILCAIFGEFVDQEKGSIEVSALITQEVEHRLKTNDIKGGYYAMFNADPKERYFLFNETYKHYAGADWNCDAARKLLN